MTEPRPEVSTAPAEGATASTAPGRRRRLPAHIGPARTSTVLLAVAFLLIGLLYLFVKPPETSRAATTGDESPSTSRTSDPTTRAPETTAPSSTAPPTSEVPATSEEPTPTEEPAPTEEPTESTETTAPEEPTEPTVPELTTEPPPS